MWKVMDLDLHSLAAFWSTASAHLLHFEPEFWAHVLP